MTLVGPDENGDRPQREESREPCEQPRTYLIYRLMRVEHHAGERHRRMVISDAGLEIELELLRELNNCLDGPDSIRRPPVTGSDDPGALCDVSGDIIAKRRLKDFHPGFKVTVVMNDGNERMGLAHWTPDAPTGHELRLL